MMVTPRKPAAEVHLDWPCVIAHRLRRHHLAARAPSPAMLDVAADLCGLHAQVMSSAELTLWARLDDPHPTAVATALWTDRTLVKTWAMRGTLHLLPARAFGTYVAALSHRPRTVESASWRDYFGVSTEEVDALRSGIDRVLRDAMLTRQELAERVAAETGQPALREHLAGSWGAFLKPSAMDGHVVFAPGEGPKVRFTHPATWLPAWEDVDPDAGIRDLLRQYLRTYGPANREDVARWFGVPAAPAGRLLARLADETTPVAIGEHPRIHWALTADLPALQAAEPAPSVHLLPGFDQYVVNSPRDVDEILPQKRKMDVFRPQGWISPVLLIDGRIGGVWRHERKGRRLLVTVSPFGRPNAAIRKRATARAERLAAYLGGELDIAWT